MLARPRQHRTACNPSSAIARPSGLSVCRWLDLIVQAPAGNWVICLPWWSGGGCCSGEADRSVCRCSGECSTERKFQGAQVPWNFRSWEREFQGAKVLYVSFCFLELSFPGAKVQRNEVSHSYAPRFFDWPSIIPSTY